MKILRNLFIGFLLISILLVDILLIRIESSYSLHRSEKEFLDKYEHEDFSQFKGVDMYIRGYDNQSLLIICGETSYLKNDSLIFCDYALKMDTQNHKIHIVYWTFLDKEKNADTIKLKNLTEIFIDYKIPRIDVDTAGNVFVYIKDRFTLSFVKFANRNELIKRSKEYRWIKIKNSDNWYKP
jgi:hypothetical protein